MTATQRWQRLGLDGTALVMGRRNVNLGLEALEREDAFSHRRLFSSVDDCFGAVALGHLHLVSREEALRRAAQGTAAALEWAFGDWRDPRKWKGPRRQRPRREMQRGESGWFEDYRWGLLMAFVSEDLNAVQRLLQWPEPDLMLHEGTFYYTKEDNWFHIYLAMTLLGKRPEECSQLLEKLEQSRRPHARFMLMAGRGISMNEPSRLARALRELASYHRTHRLDRNNFLLATDADASLLWHIARSRGLDPVSLAADVQDLILSRDSLLPDGGTPISDEELTRDPGPSPDHPSIDDFESGSGDPEHDLRRAEEALRLMLVVLTAADDFPGGVAALVESVDFALVHQQGGGGDGFDVEKIAAPFQRVAGWALRLEYEGEQEARAAAVLESFKQACLGLKPIGFKVHPDVREALKLLKSLS